jgi:hypothetical protein
LQRKGVDLAAKPLAQGVVNHPVPAQPVQPPKDTRNNRDVEVAPAMSSAGVSGMFGALVSDL